jgi:plasmid stabilization system protein ParE
MRNFESAAASAAQCRMADYLYTAAARADLNIIWQHIAEDNVDVADRVEREIQVAVQKLASAPTLGHVRRDLTSKDVRFWRVHSYLIVYDPASRPLLVLRILSGYRDIAALLEPRAN